MANDITRGAAVVSLKPNAEFMLYGNVLTWASDDITEPTTAEIVKYEKSGDFIYAQSELDLEPWPQRLSYFFDPNDYRLYVSHIHYTSKPLVTTNVFDCINTQYIKTFRRQ